MLLLIKNIPFTFEVQFLLVYAADTALLRIPFLEVYLLFLEQVLELKLALFPDPLNLVVVIRHLEAIILQFLGKRLSGFSLIKFLLFLANILQIASILLNLLSVALMYLSQSSLYVSLLLQNWCFFHLHCLS